MKMNANQEFNIAETPLTDEQLAQFKPIEQVLPPDQLNMLLTHQAQQKRRGKQSPNQTSHHNSPFTDCAGKIPRHR